MSNLDIPLVLPELKFELIVYFQHNSETNVGTSHKCSTTTQTDCKASFHCYNYN